jgi:hypothetical protein
MSNLLPLAEQDGDDPKDRGQRQRSYKRQRRADPLPNAEQIQRMILALNEAIILGTISPRVATVIQRSLRMLLDAQLRRDRQPGTASNSEALVELCRRDPNVLQTIEPLLSDGQLDAIMKEISRDKDDEAS